LIATVSPVFGRQARITPTPTPWNAFATVSGGGHSVQFSLDDPGDGETHVCGTDFSSESALQVSAAIFRARTEGRLSVARKTASPPSIGDERDFRVNRYPNQDETWPLRKFTLVDKTDGLYYLWVDRDHLGTIDAQDKSYLHAALSSQTPNGSVDPGKGIFENNETYFGPPPDVDGDGVTDILVYDLDNLGGFVSYEDVNLSAPDTVGNHADVLHIDSGQSREWLAAVIAHELTHLLHLSSGWDYEYTFNTEGYAEYAMILNGYTERIISYLNFEYPNERGWPVDWEYTLPLFTWRYTPSNGGPESRDYQRGGLFFTYVANQTDPSVVGGMLKGQRKGPNGLDSVLVENGSSLNTIIGDFHTANFVNDPDLDPRYGYDRPGRSQLHAAIDPPFDGEVRFAGPEGPDYMTLKKGIPIKTGAVRYWQWKNVADFLLLIDSDNYQQIANDEARERERVFQEGNYRIRAYGVRTDGTRFVQDVNAKPTYQRFFGRFSSLTFVVAHSFSFNGDYNIEAYWTPLSKTTDAETDPAVPAATALLANYPNPFNPQTVIPFELAEGGHVRLAVFDLLGRQVAILADERFGPGRHERTFDAAGLSSGVYFVRLSEGERIETRAISLLR